MKKKEIYKYEDNPITFNFGNGQRMVNATEMIKSFPSKKMNNFLRTKQTKEFILALEKRYAEKRIADNMEVLRVVKGGLEPQGTWMDEKLALKFAAWLSVDFELWVWDRIHDLLTEGMINEKHLKWTIQKIQDNAQENYILANWEQLKNIKNK